MSQSHITPLTRIRAKTFRRAMTDAERRLWAQLRGHRLTSLHFRRQAPIGPYIADFVSFAAKVVIELDGGQHGHEARARRDSQRDRWLGSQGFLVLRFWNHEVFQTLDSVKETIFARCAERLPADHPVNAPFVTPSPTLPHEGGGSARVSTSPLVGEVGAERREGVL